MPSLAVRPFDQRVAEIRRSSTWDLRQRDVFDRAISLVDRAKLAVLEAYVAANYATLAQRPSLKYLDLPFYLREKSRFITDLDLDRPGPCRILDLGSGAGHFLFLAKCYGHRVLGIDIDDDLYTRMLGLYAVQRRRHMIVSGEPLELPGKFDLITSMEMTYNRPVGRAKLGRSTTFWTADEWGWFFDQICLLLRYPGRIFFHLNIQPDPVTGRHESSNLLALFEKNGAEVDADRQTALFRLSEPLRLVA